MDRNGRVWKMKSELRPAKTWLGSDLPRNSLRFLRIPWDLLGIPWDCLRVFRRFLRISLGILQDSLGFPFGYQQRRMYCLRRSATNSTLFAPDKYAPACQFPGVCQLPTAKGPVQARHARRQPKPLHSTRGQLTSSLRATFRWLSRIAGQQLWWWLTTMAAFKPPSAPTRARCLSRQAWHLSV